MHSSTSLTVDSIHLDYFNTNDYLLLSHAKGAIFNENSDDQLFIVFDHAKAKTLLILYQESIKEYLELYNDIMVVNELDTMLCSSYSSTLDYVIAEEIIYQGEYLIKEPSSYLEYPPIKIGNLASDLDLALEDGCISDERFKVSGIRSFCISTSAVYNNWTCLYYDKGHNHMVAFYSQAFAD